MKALLLTKADSFKAQVTNVDEADMPEGDVTLSVEYSTLNYKDGLALTNKSPVVRYWPMVAGIDGAGTVIESSHPRWKAGDLVVHNGWGLGETRWGCLAEKVRLQGDWLVRIPKGLTPRLAMAIGTAGYTAMLCVQALEDHGVQPTSGEILVTGATGGVGSVAVALLSQLGYTVVAVTGKSQEEAYLKSLGASAVVERAVFSEPGKLFQKERWAGVVDAVGSHTLANALAQTRYGGVVAACGLAQGMDLQASVMPFILRGVSLIGVDSVMAPLEKRQRAWDRLARDLPAKLIGQMVEDISLDQVLDSAQRLMAGQVRGRLVVNLRPSPAPVKYY